jgi:hypothetical protein
LILQIVVGLEVHANNPHQLKLTKKKNKSNKNQPNHLFLLGKIPNHLLKIHQVQKNQQKILLVQRKNLLSQNLKVKI